MRKGITIVYLNFAYICVMLIVLQRQAAIYDLHYNVSLVTVVNGLWRRRVPNAKITREQL